MVLQKEFCATSWESGVQNYNILWRRFPRASLRFIDPEALLTDQFYDRKLGLFMRSQTLAEAAWILAILGLLAVASWFVSIWLAIIFWILILCYTRVLSGSGSWRAGRSKSCCGCGRRNNHRDHRY